jgi:GT2 family glycosyltransferase
MPENMQAATPSVLISILNWNAAEATLRCIDSLALQHTQGLAIRLSVIDNGSRPEEWRILEAGARARQVALIRQEENLGFAGGHNLSMRTAIADGVDYVWLLNNDATVYPDALQKMVGLMAQDPRCGAVAPLSIAEHDASRIDFAGARHDWRSLSSIRIASASETAAFEQSHPDEMWISGTAVLFRVDALKEVGVLDDKLFAYFEDNDISARLAAAGWKNRMAFDAKIVHACHDGKDTNRPPYFFYLMQRNFFRFWRKNTPANFRRLLNLRLLDRSLYEVNKLYYEGFEELGDAALLGTSDGFWGKTGAPRLQRRPSVSMIVLKSLFNLQHGRALKRLERKNKPGVPSRI